MITISWVFLICGTIDVEMVYCLDLELGIVECGNSFRRTDDPDPARIFPNSGITILSNVFNNTTHIIEKFAVWSM